MCEHQCDDCKFAVWELYKECGYSMWNWVECKKEDEITEDEAMGKVPCSMYCEVEIERPD